MRSFPCHVTRVPIDTSTSKRRLTSSMRGTSRSVVVPLFRSEAARSPTAPFFEVFVVTDP